MIKEFGQATLRIDENKKRIIWIPKGNFYLLEPESNRSWRESLDVGVAEMCRLHQEGRKYNWLNDCSQAEYVDSLLVHDVQNFNERLYTIDGHFKLAFIKSKYGLFNVAINTYIADTILNHRCNFSLDKFDTLEEADQWLES